MPKAKPRKKSKSTPGACPCGSRRPFTGCCEPLHKGNTAARTPAELVRSRYSAFARSDGDYLWNTLHSQHEERLAGDADQYRQQIAASGNRGTYLGLTLLDSREAGADGVAQVLFLARVSHGKLDRSMVELSSFVEEAGQWRYITGTTRQARDLVQAPGNLTIERWHNGQIEEVQHGAACGCC